LQALLADNANNAVLVLNVPTALASPAATAKAVAAVVGERRATIFQPKPVLASRIGADATVASTFAAADVPHYATEADAVRGFMHLVRYVQARDALMETPPSLLEDFAPDVAAARRPIEETLLDGRRWLDPLAAAQVLTAYGIATVPTALAGDPDHAGALAQPFLATGDAIVVKIQSPDIVHMSDIGGVRLGLTTRPAVEAAAADIIARARAARPDARIAGVIVQPMIIRPKAWELIVGIADDPTFGPVIAFGQGGTAVEVIGDKALALPPLDLKMAGEKDGGVSLSERNIHRRSGSSRISDQFRQTVLRRSHALGSARFSGDPGQPDRAAAQWEPAHRHRAGLRRSRAD
jgi:acetyltransferase